jgi:hypothetical protein
LNLLDIFNKENQREYYTNSDYGRVGGKVSEVDSCIDADGDENYDEEADDVFNDELGIDEADELESIKSSSKKDRKNSNMTV